MPAIKHCFGLAGDILQLKILLMLTLNHILRAATAPLHKYLVTAGLHTTAMAQAKVALVFPNKFYVNILQSFSFILCYVYIPGRQVEEKVE